MSYSNIIDTLSLLVGILGLILQFKEYNSPDTSVSLSRTYYPSNVEQKNLKTKSMLIYYFLLAALFIYSSVILYTNWGEIPVSDAAAFTFPILSDLNSYIFFTVNTLTKSLSFTVPILSGFVFIKYLINKKMAYRGISIISYAALTFFSYKLSALFKTLNFLNLSIVSFSQTTIDSLLSFARIYTGVLSILQVMILFFVINHLVQNLLLIENKSVYLDKQIWSIAVKILLPVLFLFIILYWKFVL
ncbi:MULTISPECIES: hypothetical protein [Enterococcus]|uniref:hypothetical protein n=1 Tax=Enterococcus TaxID=1350 RepID=UPI00232F04A9|nr:hypothetical protein [Enterococcus avium]MDB1730087.1 hypothetical protein [Enterococcus avium]MDB1734360.1 hypothetical protein [Enterococcus avium]